MSGGNDKIKKELYKTALTDIYLLKKDIDANRYRVRNLQKAVWDDDAVILSQMLSEIATAKKNINWGDILNKPTSMPPNGAAGGDLTGTYPDPTIGFFQTLPVLLGVPILNDVITWDGAKWISQAGGGGGGAVTSVNALVGVVPLTGTANRITISAANLFDIGTDVVTLAGAQALSNKSGLISQWTNDAGYVTSSSPALTATYVGYGDGANLLTGDSNFTWGSAAQDLTVGATVQLKIFNSANAAWIAQGDAGYWFTGTASTGLLAHRGFGIDLKTSEIYTMGDVGINNNTHITVNDTTQKIFLYEGSTAGASAGDVWTLVSNATGEGAWTAPAGGASPLTTKGDLYTFSTVDARLAIGATNGMFLQVASGATTGNQWSPYTLPVAVPTVGKILRSDGTNMLGTTATYPDTVTSGRLIMASASNVVSDVAMSGDATITNAGVITVTSLANLKKGSFGATWDGQGGVIGTGAWQEITIPYAGTITDWVIDSYTPATGIAVSGSIIIELYRSGASIIGAGNKPTLSSASTNSAAVSGWTSTAVAAGDKLYAYVSSTPVSCLKVTCTFNITKT